MARNVNNINQNETSVSRGEEDSKTNLIINFLPESITEDDIRALFAKFGEIERCKLVNDRTTGRSLQYGFVNYHQAEGAKKAIQTLNGFIIENKTIKVSYARTHSEEMERATLFVSGFATNISLQAFESLFKPFGKIKSVHILHDRVAAQRYARRLRGIRSGPPFMEGIGFVNFERHVDAKRAIMELNGTVAHGYATPLRVKFSNSKSKNQRSIECAQPTQDNNRYGMYNRRSDYMRYTPTITSWRGYGWCVYVYNLAPDTSDSVLWSMFGPFGPVLSIEIFKNRCTGAAFGFVIMTNYFDAIIAVQNLNGSILGDRMLQITFRGLV